MEGIKYQQILEENVLEAVSEYKLGLKFSFKKKNVFKLTTRATTEWFGLKHVH